MSQPEIFTEPLEKAVLRRLIDESFGDMVKFVVDLARGVICVGGGLHSDEESMLLEDGSLQSDLWGGNYYPDLPGEDRFEYKSMINQRPSDGNRQQHIESDDIRRQVRELAGQFLEPNP